MLYGLVSCAFPRNSSLNKSNSKYIKNKLYMDFKRHLKYKNIINRFVLYKND